VEEFVDNRRMRINMNKTKVVITGEPQKVMHKAVTWPCRLVKIAKDPKLIATETKHVLIVFF